MLRNKSWQRMLAVTTAVLFGMLVIGCGKDDNPAGGGSGLDGTWVSSGEEGTTLSLNNGSFEISANAGTMLEDKAVKMIKGTYSTSGGSFTLTPAQIHGDMFNAILLGEMEEMGELFKGKALESKWYTKNELKTAMIALFGSMLYAMMDGDEMVDEMFNELTTPRVGTYVLDKNTLTITFEDETETFTRK
jgi:hypothetical protein